MVEAAHFRQEPVFNRLFAFDERRQGHFAKPATAGVSARAPLLLYSVFADVTHRFGFDDFLVANLPGTDDFSFDEQVILTSYSPTIVAEFDRQEAMINWTVFEQLCRSNLPYAFVAQENLHSDDTVSDEPDCLTAIGANRGCCIPLSRIDGGRAFVLLTGAFGNATPSLAEMALEIARLFERLVSSIARQAVPVSSTSLNHREVECLKWAAAGKTSSEIALITALSEHTINHYLNICCRKLDAVNRVQAVAKAIRLSII